MALESNVLFPEVRKNSKSEIWYQELCAEDETQINRNEQIRIDNFKSCFSRVMIEWAGTYDEDENDDSQGLTQFLDQNREWK